jgi:hypothetical protein
MCPLVSEVGSHFDGDPGYLPGLGSALFPLGLPDSGNLCMPCLRVVYWRSSSYPSVGRVEACRTAKPPKERADMRLNQGWPVSKRASAIGPCESRRWPASSRRSVWVVPSERMTLASSSGTYEVTKGSRQE